MMEGLKITATLVGITKPVGPGQNVIYRHDDVSFGEERCLGGKRPKTTGYRALAALVLLRFGFRADSRHISTGDEAPPSMSRRESVCAHKLGASSHL